MLIIKKKNGYDCADDRKYHHIERRTHNYHISVTWNKINFSFAQIDFTTKLMVNM